MKFLKTFESHSDKFAAGVDTLEHLKKDIEELNYILNDEDIWISIEKHSSLMKGRFLSVSISVPGGNFVGVSNTKEYMDQVYSNQEFNEWLDRVGEVAKGYGYVVNSAKDSEKRDIRNIYIHSPHYIEWKDAFK